MNVADGTQACPALLSESTDGAEERFIKEIQTHGTQQEGLDYSTSEGKKCPNREGCGCRHGNETLLPIAPSISVNTAAN